MVMNKIGMGFAGYGMIGRVHALAYRELGHYYPKGLPAVDLAGVCTSSVDTAIKAAQDAGIKFWKDQIDELVSAICQDCEPAPFIVDGLAVQQVITAAYASAKTNQWVEVAS